MTSRRLLVAGTLGSALLALGATGVGALAPGWGLLREQTALALGLCVAGLVLLAGAWWALRAAASPVLVRASVLWSVPLLLTPPLGSRDLYAYAGQAALVAASRDPYEQGPASLGGPLSAGVDDVWKDSPAPYGPVWLSLAGLVVRITGDHVVPALVGLRLLAVIGVALIGWALARLAPGSGRALWLGVANPVVLLHLVSGGHNDALMVGLMAAGVALAFTVRGSAALVAAAVLVTLAALVKVPALAALAYLPLAVPGWRPRLRRAGLVGAAAAVTAVVAAYGTGLGWGWLGTLDAGRARLSLFSPLTGLGQALGALDAVLAAGLVVAALLCAGLLLAADRLGPLTALGLTLLGVALLLPVVQPWYVLWGVCLLAAVVRPRAATALGAGCLVLSVLVAPSGRNVIRPPLYGVPMLLAAVVTLVVLRTGRSSDSDVEGGTNSTRWS